MRCWSRDERSNVHKKLVGIKYRELFDSHVEKSRVNWILRAKVKVGKREPLNSIEAWRNAGVSNTDQCTEKQSRNAADFISIHPIENSLIA